MLQNCETENSVEKMRNEKNGLATKFIHAQMKTISRLSQARRNVGISLTLERVKRTLESKPTRDQVKFSQLSDISTFHCLCNERRSGAGAWKRGCHVRNNGPVRFPSLLRNFSRRSWTLLFIAVCRTPRICDIWSRYLACFSPSKRTSSDFVECLSLFCGFFALKCSLMSSSRM